MHMFLCLRCCGYIIFLVQNVWIIFHILKGIWSLRGHSIIIIVIFIKELRPSSDRLRFVMGIAMPENGVIIVARGCFFGFVTKVSASMVILNDMGKIDIYIYKTTTNRDKDESCVLYMLECSVYHAWTSLGVFCSVAAGRDLNIQRNALNEMIASHVFKQCFLRSLVLSTRCGLVISNGNMNLGQHWLR